MSGRRSERNQPQLSATSRAQRASAARSPRLQPAAKAQPLRAQQRAAPRCAPAAATTHQRPTQVVTSHATRVQQPAQMTTLRSGRASANARYSDETQEQHAFLDAAKNNHFDQVRSLVIAKPSLIDCQPAGRWSALHQAAQFGNADAVRFLLANGASPLVLTSDGRTPLEVAEPTVLEILMEATFNYTAACSNEANKQRAASEAAIQGLPTIKFSSCASEKEEEDESKIQCHICLSDYVDGDTLRELRCSHTFHACCVDTWLREKSGSCPICRCDTISAA